MCIVVPVPSFLPMQDNSKADGQPWTRFVFNTDALLEEEANADDAGNDVGLGAFDFRQHNMMYVIQIWSNYNMRRIMQMWTKCIWGL